MLKSFGLIAWVVIRNALGRDLGGYAVLDPQQSNGQVICNTPLNLLLG